MQEIWKDIEGYEGIYQVSNLGNVKSLHKRGANGRNIAKQKMPNGYLTVHLSKNGKATRISVHRLVAFAFLDRKEGCNQVNHINENKEDNRVENLEWCNQKYNNTYGSRIEKATKTLFLNNKMAIPVLQLTLDGVPIKIWNGGGKGIQRETGYDQSAIWHCCNNIKRTAYGFRWQYAK